MHDEDSGEATKCPHCDSTENCEHLLAVLDLTHGTCVRGHLTHQLSAFEGLLGEAFLRAAKRPRVEWTDEDVAALWTAARESAAGAETFPELDRALLMRVVRKALEAGGADEAPGRMVDDGDGPGNASSLVVYFARDVRKAFNAAVRALVEPLLDTLKGRAWRDRQAPVSAGPRPRPQKKRTLPRKTASGPKRKGPPPKKKR